MRKFFIFIIFVSIIGAFSYYFFKPITMHYLSEHFSEKLNRKVELTSLNFWPLKLDGLVTLKYYKEKVKIHAKYAGEFTTDKKKLGPVILTSNSLGGLITITFIDQTKEYDITLENVDLKKFALALGDKDLVNSGTVDGEIKYYKRTRTGYTDLNITKATINTIDIEKEISQVNDALEFDIFNLLSSELNEKNNLTTYVDKAQLNFELKDKTLYTKDIALRTSSFRIVLLGNAHQKGKINEMEVHLVNDLGCAMVTQQITGTIQKPKVSNAQTAVVKAVKKVPASMPSSFFGMGRHLLNYGRDYTIIEQYVSKSDFGISSDMMDNGDYIFKYASKNVPAKDCRVIYNGNIKHPKKN